MLWVGDACCPTGFARVTHNIIPYLQDQWDVSVLGINYRGDPHKHGYPIYPASTGSHEDVWGLARFPAMLNKLKPDVVLVNNDPWNVINFLDVAGNVPIVSYMPVDSPNMRSDVALKLNKAVLNICYTEFGVTELVNAGLNRLRTAVVPHGVDSELYRPMDKAVARKTLGFENEIPSDAFVVGNVNRNQQRKRLDLTVIYFAKWLLQCKMPDNVFLHLHCKLRDIGWDLLQLADYFGLKGRVLLTDTKLDNLLGIDESVMPYIYNCFNVQMSTTMGEGWGLTTHEGMSCGIPQIVPEWSALGEWPRGAVRYVPVSGVQATVAAINTIGGICSEDGMVKALDQMYRSPDLLEEYGKLAYARATETRFSWASVSAQILDLLEKVRGKPRVNALRSCTRLLDTSKIDSKGDLGGIHG